MKMDEIIRHKGEYRPIEDWADYVPHFSKREVKGEDDEPAYNGIEALHDHPDILAKVKSRLEDFRFHRIAYMRHGDSAAVFKTVDAQLVRISVDGHEPPRLYHPAILQPIFAEIMQGEFTTIRFEIMPAVKELRNGHNIHHDELKKKLLPILEAALRNSNLNPTDLKAANVGILFDGTPIVVDGGAVETMFNNRPILIDGEHLEQWFTGNGSRIWKQQHYFPRIGTGKITGVITEQDIRNLEEKGHHNLAQCIREQQLCYNEELGAWVARAAEQTGDSFTQSLKKTYNEQDRLAGPRKSWRRTITTSNSDPSNDLAQH